MYLSTAPRVVSVQNINTSLTKPYDKEETNKQTRLLCTYFHCDKSSGFSDVTIIKQLQRCCRYMYHSRLQANKVISSEVNVQKTRAR